MIYILRQKEIYQILSQRPPFLMVDRILQIEPGRRAVGIKNITPELLYCYGGTEEAGFPQVLVLEAMAQVGAIAILTGLAEQGKKTTLFTGMDKVNFYAPVNSGDQLRLEVEILGVKRGMGRRSGRAWVGDRLVAEGVLWFAIVDKPNLE